MAWVCRFQSTLPAGEATSSSQPLMRLALNFNPRFPRGKRPPVPNPSGTYFEFQSTLPAGEATRNWPHWILSTVNFNPRFPRGKRPYWTKS